MALQDYQLLTPKTAGRLVTALNGLKRGSTGEVTFAMRSGLIGRSAALHCSYSRKQRAVLCVFDNSQATITTFPVSSAGILERGVPSLEGGYPPPDISEGEHETRWRVGRDGNVEVYCSQVVKEDGLLVVWTDWRSFTSGRKEHSRPLSDSAVDVKMFGRVCPKV